MNSRPSSDFTLVASHSDVWFDRTMESIFAWWYSALVVQAAGELSRECRPSVWSEIRERAHDMTLEQVQGFVRSIAPNHLLSALPLVIARHRARRCLGRRIVAEATERLIELIAEDFRCAKAPATTRQFRAA